ncbi:MAG TPA: hypothetical protein DEH78_13435 [Solibacterales bacterium]|nr:hypothetical protein [Bryobacterales bacterium]
MGGERRETAADVTRTIDYSPLPSQRLFHSSQARFKGFSGPVGSGKSQALCQEAIRLSYVNAGRLGVIGAPTYAMLRDATQTTLLEILNANGLPYELNKAEKVIRMLDTGSRILLRSLDAYERLRGTNLAWFAVDELTYCEEEAWQRLEARLRDPKASWLAGVAAWTPKGRDWVYRRFMAERVEGYSAIIAKPFENRYLLDAVPDFYERLKRSYDQQFYEQEVLGEYVKLQDGQVYHAFDRAGNLRSNVVAAAEPLLWAMDFNVEPMCSVVVQLCGDEIRVLDEIVLSRASTRDACEEFSRRYPWHGRGVTVYGDASGSRRQTAGGTDYDIVREHFGRQLAMPLQLRVPRSNPAVRERIALVNGMLKSAAGRRRLIIDPRCRELVKDLEEVSYKDRSGDIDKTKDPRRTHLSDALGYLIWQECRPRPQLGEQNKPLF